MKKNFRQVKIQAERDPNEFGIIMVDSESARVSSKVELMRGLNYSIIHVWTLDIEIEIKN